MNLRDSTKKNRHGASSVAGKPYQQEGSSGFITLGREATPSTMQHHAGSGH